MDMTVVTVRQHLIDPELCVRCNGCEDTCGQGAIKHDFRNYAVDADLCNECMECVEQCPTGAADQWREVPLSSMYSLEEQLLWDSLPAPQVLVPGQAPAASPVHRMAPASAPWPVIGQHSRETPAVAQVVSNRRVTTPDADSDIHHIVLAFADGDCQVVEGQSIGVLPPGVDSAGEPHVMRLYSVASARTGEAGQPGHLALTVKRVMQDSQGQAVPGLCSNYLCDLAEGDAVQVVGPFGANFLMPDAPQAKLIMVATGTGIAPMRAMLERCQSVGTASADRLMLFYGGRTPQDMPYFEQLQGLDGQALSLHCALSRVAGQPKRYVQDLMVEQGDQMLRWLTQADGYLFACGLRGMEAGIMNALEAACQRAGMDWATLQQRLRSEHRLHLETY